MAEKKICAYCNKEIEQNKGGRIRLPKVLHYGYLQDTVDLHNKCVKPYLFKRENEITKLIEKQKLTAYGWKAI